MQLSSRVATISLAELQVQLLFEGSYYSGAASILINTVNLHGKRFSQTSGSINFGAIFRTAQASPLKVVLAK